MVEPGSSPQCQDDPTCTNAAAGLATTNPRGRQAHRPTYAKLADRVLGTPDQRRAAKLAYEEFQEVVRWSDGWLFLTLVFFIVLGNTYPVQRRSEILVGVAGFVVCFLIYVAMKARERRLDPPLKRWL